MTLVYLGIGTNVEQEKHACLAVTELQKLDADLRASTVYRCPAAGFEGADFYNFVVELRTSLSLSELSAQLRAVELAHGRPQRAEKNQDRTLDIDILLFGSEVSANAPQVPRRDIFRFNFVLQPLFELCPDLVVPLDGRDVRTIWLETFDKIGGLSNLTPINLTMK